MPVILDVVAGPSHWARYLLEGDPSVVSEERLAVDLWLKKNRIVQVHDTVGAPFLSPIGTALFPDLDDPLMISFKYLVSISCDP